MSNNQKQIAPLETITASTLMNTDYPPLSFSIEKLLPQGIFILAGSGKIGKSWLALDMCVAVSTGGRLWDFCATHGDVLYLALEDTHPRLQNRLQLIQEENINTNKLHLAISSLGISDGLITQMKEFLITNPHTKLIVIDTLERIRNTDQDKSMYACDYRDMTALREITNAHAVTLLLVHHTRKMYDPDPLNTLSGSTGLVGAVDGVWVLEKEKRTGDKGKLTIANRDTEGYCFSVLFDKENCRWNCLGKAEDVADEEHNSFCLIINEFVKTVWRGTSTGLCEAMAKAGMELGLSSATVTKMLNKNKDILQSNYGIIYSYDRKKSERIITLARVDDDR